MEPFAIERRTYTDGTVEDVPLFLEPPINYSTYFAAEPTEADHIANAKAALAGLKRDLSSCPVCAPCR